MGGNGTEWEGIKNFQPVANCPVPSEPVLNLSKLHFGGPQPGMSQSVSKCLKSQKTAQLSRSPCPALKPLTFNTDTPASRLSFPRRRESRPFAPAIPTPQATLPPTCHSCPQHVIPAQGDLCVTVIPAPDPESRGGGQVGKDRPISTSYALRGVMQRSPQAGISAFRPSHLPAVRPEPFKATVEPINAPVESFNATVAPLNPTIEPINLSVRPGPRPIYPFVLSLPKDLTAPATTCPLTVARMTA